MTAKHASLQGLACVGFKHGEGQWFPLISVKNLGCSPLLDEFQGKGALRDREDGDARVCAVCHVFIFLIVCNVYGLLPWR